MTKRNTTNIRRTALLLIFACGIIAFILPPGASAAATPEIMPVEELEAGMKGYGKTVFEGLKVSKFPIRVRGILPGAGIDGGALILIELTGPEVRKYGGISLGMSGSPVYVKGRLIGAISFTFPMTDHSLGGVTPIESMIRTKKYDGVKNGLAPLEPPFEYGENTYRWIRYGKNPGGPSAPDVLEARPALAPIAIRGVSSRTFPLIREFFEESGIEVRPVQGLNTGTTPEPVIGPGSELEPGSSVAVQLVRGDLDMSAVGTLTRVDGKDVLLFGHPFFRKGEVKYLLADAYVHTIVRGDEVPFKVTSTGLLRGEVVQDRGTALLGHLDRFPKLVPLNVFVVDRDVQRFESYSYKIVQDKDILIHLIAMAVLQSLDKSIDRLGNGTSMVSFTIECDGCKEPIARENMFYDRFDISIRSLMELVAALNLLRENRFVDAPVTSIEITAEIDSTHSIASIEKAEIANKPEADEETPETASSTGAGTDGRDEAGFSDIISFGPDDNDGISLEDLAPDEEKEEEPVPIVRPGEKLDLRVRLRPYRKEPVEESIFLKVPHDIAPGRAIITIFSGTEKLPPTSPAELLIKIQVEGPEIRDQFGEDLEEEEDAEQTFSGLIKEFTERDLNNELVATIESLAFDARIDDDEDSDGEEEDERKEPKAKKKTGWVLEGSTSIKVKVAETTSFKDRPIRKSRINTLRGDN